MEPQRPLATSSEERLRRLIAAGVAITAEHALDRVLQAVVDAAQEVIGAKYVALGVLDSTGTEIDRFVTAGMRQEAIDRVGRYPTGKGILGILISDPRPLRVADVGNHPRAHGFPEHHPAMSSFLGVPIVGRLGPVGNLYLTEKIGAEEFSDEDEAVAVMLAAQAAVAVENATLYEDSQRLIHEIQSMQASRDRFYAMINHELRNALTAVYGWSDLLLRKTGPDGPRAAREVHESAERTLELLNDLLDLSRIEADRLRPSVRGADIGDLVGDAIASIEPAAAERSVELALDGVNGTAPCETDPQRVRQILINLLSNAVRHSPEGGRVMTRTVADERRIRFEVIDRGPGIPASEQGHIFEAFARAGDGEERGTGLGLTLSKQLALLLGGDLTLRSTLGKGATFTLEIPRWFGKS